MSIAWAEVSCEIPAAMVDPLAEFLVELSGSGVSIENLSLDTFSLETVEDSPTKTVKAYFPAGTELEGKVAAISAYLAEIGPSFPGFLFRPPIITYLKEEDWANNWKRHFKPSRIGHKLVIKPTWEEFSPASGDVVIELDPGQAFGTGTHATTKLCLESLERIFFFEHPFDKPGQRQPETILDVGTGSGILSIAAVKFGATRVVAIDIDPGAVAVAQENLALNRIEGDVTVATLPLEEVAGSFDIVLANILAEELVRLGPELVQRVRAGGILILSGILTEKEEFVMGGFAGYGLTLVETAREAEWSCLSYLRER
ncbi:MAG: ribosomal protein L11 [Geobacteraceae bacterium]|nr:MAG: ribosomal protein L11 [Geobacteraceae bacterium]